MPDRLSGFQRDVLLAFFRREDRFFLTGGAALAGYHLGHRTTQDLDLFTLEDVLDEAESSLRLAASDVGASVEPLRTSPDFRRRLLRRGDDALVVDLVHDRTPQLHQEKVAVGTIRIDAADEILANKLCALLSRAEIRDLIDVMLLERMGLDLDEGLKNASRKDAGFTPGQLGYVLLEVTIPDDAPVPSTSAGELRAYLDDLRGRLARKAWPA